MNDRQPPEIGTDKVTGKAPRSLNLWVVYGLMFLALLVAIGLATMIVLPFYHRR